MTAPDSYYIANVGTGDSVNYEIYKKMMTHIEFAGAPTGSVTPEFVGQQCFDTSGNIMYIAVGLAAANWAALHA